MGWIRKKGIFFFSHSIVNCFWVLDFVWFAWFMQGDKEKQLLMAKSIETLKYVCGSLLSCLWGITNELLIKIWNVFYFCRENSLPEFAYPLLKPSWNISRVCIVETVMMV